jgi:YfiH family protein
MIRFDALEKRGARVAAMSDVTDGDCRLNHELGIASRRRFFEACGINPEHVTSGRQVHSARVAVVREADRGRGTHESLPAFAETDGLVTDVASLPLIISIADCVPVFLLDAKRGAIGLVHAGRVGTQNKIVLAAVNIMLAEYGSDPRDVYAVIGPSAGPDVYEVSEEMAAEFADLGFPVRGRCIDLWEANTRQLESAGVPRAQIDISGICTITSGQFHSHRAHANGSRNLALLSL